jgi:predicted dehydrogenase
MTRRLSTGLIGCGDVALCYYLPALKESKHISLEAVCDLDPERAKLAGEAFSASKIYTDYREMLKDDSIEAVVNLTPNTVHFKVNQDVLAAGRHLYTEKLMADNVEQATILLDEASKQGVTLASAPSVMLDPINIAIKEVIEAGVIGKISYVVSHNCHGGPASKGYFDSYKALVASSGLLNWEDLSNDPTWFYKKGSWGALADLGVYGLTSITGILGPAKRLTAISGTSYETVTVMGGTAKGKEIEVETDDCTLMVLDFGDGVFASVDSAWTVQATKSPVTEIFGSKGTITVSWTGEGSELDVYVEQAGGTLSGWIKPSLSDEEPWNLASGIDHFGKHILYGDDLLIGGEHARHVIDIVNAAETSSREGRTIDLKTSF